MGTVHETAHASSARHCTPPPPPDSEPTEQVSAPLVPAAPPLGSYERLTAPPPRRAS